MIENVYRFLQNCRGRYETWPRAKLIRNEIPVDTVDSQSWTIHLDKGIFGLQRDVDLLLSEEDFEKLFDPFKSLQHLLGSWRHAQRNKSREKKRILYTEGLENLILSRNEVIWGFMRDSLPISRDDDHDLWLGLSCVGHVWIDIASKIIPFDGIASVDTTGSRKLFLQPEHVRDCRRAPCRCSCSCSDDLNYLPIETRREPICCARVSSGQDIVCNEAGSEEIVSQQRSMSCQRQSL